MTQELTQEQKCEKLGVLLATAVEAIVTAKSDMTESDLVEVRAMIQKAIDELRHQYGID